MPLKKAVAQVGAPDAIALARVLGAAQPIWDELVRHLETEYAPVMKELAAIKLAS